MDYRVRLKNLRIENKLDQKDVATICNVTNKTVSHWETLRIEVPIDCLIKLCDYYNVTSDFILGLQSNENIYKNQEKQK